MKLGEADIFEVFQRNDWLSFGIQLATGVASIYYGWKLGSRYGVIGSVAGAAVLPVAVKIPENYILRRTLDPIYLREVVEQAQPSLLEE